MIIAVPIAIKIAAAIAAAVGANAAIKGVKKIKDADSKVSKARNNYELAYARYQNKEEAIKFRMDNLGRMEMEIIASFGRFSDLMERVQMRPEFKKINKNGIKIGEYQHEEIKKVSKGATILAAGLSSSVAGAAGGFAASGAATAAVTALGTAATGVAISSLSGAAAVNATLAVLGGGTLAAGGGGIAVGAAVLSAATFGVGLLVGGIVVNFMGDKFSGKAEVTYNEYVKAESSINKVCRYFNKLYDVAYEYQETLIDLKKIMTSI